MSGPAKLALVIGNGDYGHLKRNLKNPPGDAAGVAAKLRALGYETTLKTDLDAAGLRAALEGFCAELRKVGGAARNAAAVVYFAGHGLQAHGENYLLPARETIRNEQDLEQKALRLNDMLKEVGKAAGCCVAFLDCCRDNAFRAGSSADEELKRLAASRGLAAPTLRQDGFFIAFATAPNSYADDGKGAHSPFAQGLIECIEAKNATIFNMMLNVRRKVRALTYGRQLPWDQSSLTEHFGFNFEPDFDPGAVPTLAELERRREEEYWELTRDTDSPDLVRAFLREFPETSRRPEAQALLDRLAVMRWRQKILRRVGQGASAALGLFVLWFGAMWFSFSDRVDESREDARPTLEAADLYGGDILLPVAGSKSWGDGSISACRAVCVLNVSFGCVGFNYDKETKRCYLKSGVHFYTRGRGNKYSDTTSLYSMYIANSYIFSGAVKPTESQFIIVFARKLTGNQVNPEEVHDGRIFCKEADEIGCKERTYRFSSGTAPFWRVAGHECEQKCLDLGEKCEGFNFSPMFKACELLSNVDGILNDPSFIRVSGSKSSEVQLVFPGSYSGCRFKTKSGLSLENCTRPKSSGVGAVN